MTEWYSWCANGNEFATIAGIDADESILLTPLGAKIDAARSARLRVVHDDNVPSLVADFPHTGLLQPKIFSSRAWEHLRYLLEKAGTNRNASISGHPDAFTIWYPAKVADCLVEQKSTIFESISGFRKLLEPTFRESDVPSGLPFTVKGFETQDVWVDGRLRDWIMKSGLSGSEFRLTAVSEE